VLGNDRLTVTVPLDAAAKTAPITVARADGAAARGPSGMNVLPFEVLAPDPPPAAVAVKQAPPAAVTAEPGNGN
jgi:hypothetical protein